MKSTARDKTLVQTGNYAAMQALVNHAKLPPEKVGVLLLVADMLDEIAGGSDEYMVIGTTRARNAFSLSVKGDDVPDPIYAASLAELNELAFGLL